MPAKYHLIATCAFGLESVTARELHDLGYTETQSHNGYIEFTGPEAAIARSNLWLRTADRVMLKVGSFHADTFEALFEQTKALPWVDLLPRDAHFPVEGRSVKSQLSSVPACQSIVKKAIVESLKRHYDVEVFPETGPRYDIEVSIHNDEAILSIDTSGAALHKRGYRTESAAAPIKETLGAALVLLSRWRAHRPFADPMCGSGTIPIEAALLARNIPPGIGRSFVSQTWPILPKSIWEDAMVEAHDLEVRTPLNIIGSDVDTTAIEMAKRHASQAGVDKDVIFKTWDATRFQPSADYGCIITNPPYGDRLGEQSEVEELYRQIGKSFRRAQTWSTFIITSHPRFEALYGKRADKRRKLYNGRIQTQLYQYLGPLPPRNNT